MDDRDFDKKIRSKAEELSPAYKESAWQRLEQRLLTLPPVPWYQKWGGWLFGGTMGLLTLLNLGILWQTHLEKEEVAGMLPAKDTSVNQILYYYDTLYVRDTVYLQQETNSQNIPSLESLGGSGLLSQRNTYSPRGKVFSTDKPGTAYPSVISRHKKSLNEENSGIPPSFWQNSSDISVSSPEENQYGFLNVHPLLSTRPTWTGSLLTLPAPVEYIDHPWYDEQTARREFHQQNPLQIRLGIGAGFAIPDPDIGRRFINGQQNLGIELYFKDQVNSRLFTGITHHKLHYILEGVNQRELYTREELNKYPGFEEMERLPKSIEVENQLLHFPIHFRYYFPLNYEWSVFAGAGVGVDYLINQKFTYAFLDVENGQILGYEDVVTIHNNHLHFGSLDGTLGIQYQAGKKLSLQTSIGYRYGFGRIGIEERAMDLLNFNVGAWWQLK